MEQHQSSFHISVSDPSYDQMREGVILRFLHNLPRFSDKVPREFSPRNDQYLLYFRSVAFLCVCSGLICSAVLMGLILRRYLLVKHIRNKFAVNVVRLSTDLPAVILLGFTAISCMTGFLGEAQIDASVHMVTNGMRNASDSFGQLHVMGAQATTTAIQLKANYADLFAAYNSNAFPSHAVEQLQAQTNSLVAAESVLNSQVQGLPKNFNSTITSWEHHYFYLKSSTNFSLTLIVMTLLLSIAAIGWSMRGSLKMSIVMIALVLPLSHSLMGVYLSSSIAGADFCMAPQINTLKLVSNTSNYNIEAIKSSNINDLYMRYLIVGCDNSTRSNLTSPFNQSLKSVDGAIKKLQVSMKALKVYAKKHQNKLPNIQEKYLDSIDDQLQDIDQLTNQYQSMSSCENFHIWHKRATKTWCGYGVLGDFSLWVHQISVSILLFMSCIALLSVWERVYRRDQQMDMQYQLLSTYEEDNMEHVYLSSE